MSINLSNAAVQQFDDIVKHQYQARGRLREGVTQRNGVTGDQYKFTRMGQGIANQKATQADVTPMNVDHQRQTAILERWIAAEYTDIFDNDEVNFDEMNELGTTIAKALGRRDDQIIINAWTGGTYSATPTVGDADTGLDIAAGGTNMTVDKLRQINARFQDLEIEDGMKHITMTPAGLQSLLADEEVTSSDFNTIRALVAGELDTFLGMKFHILGVRSEGGLAQAGNIVTGYAWHMESTGFASGNIDKMTRVDWVAQKTSWLSQGFTRAGAVLRENAGVTRFAYDVTA